jgi:transcriptional regulator with XRE-family HTH domain
METQPQPTDGQPTLGDRIRTIMEERGFSQTQVATRSGIDRSDINRIVKGHRRPRLAELPLLSAVLGVSVEDLLRDVDTPPE